MYIFAWGIALLFATFPKFLLTQNTDFIEIDVMNSYVFPLVMIIVIYLFDTAFIIRSSDVAEKQLKSGFISTLLFLSFAFIFLLLSTMLKYIWIKLTLFFVCWIFISGLKWVNIRMLQEPVLELYKPKTD